MKISWNPLKAKQNRKKHGVCFPDVEEVFYDPHAIQDEDIAAVGEQRFVVLGKGSTGRHYVVIYCYQDRAVRIISARKASKAEIRIYEKGI